MEKAIKVQTAEGFRLQKRLFILGLIVSGIILTITITGVGTSYAVKNVGPLEGYFAANFTLPDVNGKKIELKSVFSKNKVTVVNFWATWCPPCRGEIPEFVAFYKKYPHKKLAILAINLREEPQKVKSFAKKAGMNFSVLTDTSGKIGDLYQIYAIPTTFIIDQKGKIRDVIKGSTSREVLEANVLPLLKGN
jgi:cytochrome c biogenesis protein CcmG, thiol:disulfide interchange protein DsbE